MQFTFTAFARLSVLAVMANTAAAVALPEPVGLEARQTNSSCSSINLCTPGVANACSCPSAVCAGLSLPGLTLPGVCLPSACQVLCSKTTDCCTNIPNTRFNCQIIPGQSLGVCLPQVL